MSMRTVEVNLTMDTEAFTRHMVWARIAMENFRIAMALLAGDWTLIDELLWDLCDDREKRQAMDRAEIRTMALAERAELVEWFDGHMDRVYVDLGLTRPESNLIRGES